MRHKLVWLSALVLSFVMTTSSDAQIVVNFLDSSGTLGDAIENTVNALPGDITGIMSPLEFAIDDEGDIVPLGTEDLIVSVISASSINGGVIGAGAGISGSFGINSGSPGTDSSTRFDSDFEEEFVISFNQAIEITEIEFNGFGTNEQFQIGSRIFQNSDAVGGNDIADISANPIFVAANTSLLIRAIAGETGGDSSVGIETFTVNIAPVPEPSSLALLGLGAIGFVSRRRRS